MDVRIEKLTLYELHDKLVGRFLSCVDLMSYQLEKIRKYNGMINAVHQIDEQRLLEEASVKDKLLNQGKSLGVLHGIPITIKDNIATKGIVTTAGVKEFATIPKEDATVVKRLKQHGAIILGKTNTPDLTLAWSTESSAYGVTKNPHNIDYSCGGSSGGEAAAIASGCSIAGVGNDFGGSIRLPCHYCGITGLRPSVGAIPNTGLVPPMEGGLAFAMSGLVSVMGPMARNVDDILCLLSILSGPDNIDPYALNTRLPIRKVDLSSLKVAYYVDDGLHLADKETVKLVEQVASELKIFCKKVEPVTPRHINGAWDLFFAIFSAEAGRGNKRLLQDNKIKPTKLLRYIFQKFEGQGKTIDEFLALWGQWDIYRSRLLNSFKSYDAIITYVMPSPAGMVNDVLIKPGGDITRVNNLVAYSLLGWPSLTIPVGKSTTGLPVGVQVISKHYSDDVTIEIGKCIERVFGKINV